MDRKINKRTGKCRNCPLDKKKSEFIKRTIQGYPTFICPQCGYRNGESIFTEYKEVKKQELIFGQPIPKGATKTKQKKS